MTDSAMGDGRMTVGTLSANGQRPNSAELRAAARDAYRASLAEGMPLSGAALGRQFEMSERWGRDRVTEVQRQDSASRGDRGHRERVGRAAQSAGGGGGAERQATPQGEPAAVASGPVVAPTGEAGSVALGDAEDGDAPADARSWLDSLIILAVAVVAAAVSYGHMEVAVWPGEPLWLARAFPLTVDGLVLAALRRGRHGRWWLALGVAVSVAANMLSRYPELAAAAGPIVSAWPPLALFGTHRLLHARK